MKVIFKCVNCEKTYEQEEVKYLCPECGKNLFKKYPLQGVLFAEYDYQEIKHQNAKAGFSIENYLPFEKEYFPEYKCGKTPFLESKRLEKKFGLENIWIKNDSLNPSGSLKDRASFLVLAQANKLNENIIVTASTGNAASSLASICASENKKAKIFVPEKVPKAKLLQMKLYGAEVIKVKGTYDDAFKLSIEYTLYHSGLNRNTAYNPYTIEGKKTAGLEIFLDNQMKVPDVILIPVGDGVIISGVYKAFYDLYKSGMTERMPRLICVQAEKSNAIDNLYHTGKYSDAENPVTIADSISVKSPSNAYMAVESIKRTNGESILVSDEEIMQGQKILAESTGIYAEPSSSSLILALDKLVKRKLIDKKENIVLLITGNGLKDLESSMKYTEI